MSLDVHLSVVKLVDVYDSNITHNLGKMAQALGIYKHLWRPEELNITKAEQLIEPLEKALEVLLKFPQTYKQYDSPNGWGNYEGLVKFIKEYLEACKEYPDASIRTSR